MKKHNILKVILCVVAFVTLCTWIFPTISFQSGLVEDARSQLGIFDFFSKENENGQLYCIRVRYARRRDRLLIRGRTRHIRRAAGILRRIRRWI